MKVVAGGIDTYDRARLKEFLSRALREIEFACDGAKVLLKPNLLSAKAPDKAATTHPEVLWALAELLLERSCQVSVGDSPGYESTEKVLEKSGIMDVVRKLHLKVAPFDRRVSKGCNGISPYREFVFGEDPDDYDLVINLPKLKTHAMMGLTAGVKNTFGFIPSLQKARWHMRCGRDAALFAALLIDIHTVARPALTVIDGVVGMDGDGPSSGRVRPVGLVALSRSAFALDLYLEEVLKISFPVPTNLLARHNRLAGDFSLVNHGVPADIEPFLRPKSVDTQWNLRGLVGEAVRSIVTRKPKCAKKRCTGCGTCVEVCPAHALRLVDDKPSFDYKECIRCYCCQEMCPEGAIKA